MKKLALALLMLPAFPPPAALASAALAIDANQGNSYGWAINYSNHANADTSAISQCVGTAP